VGQNPTTFEAWSGGKCSRKQRGPTTGGGRKEKEEKRKKKKVPNELNQV